MQPSGARPEQQLNPQSISFVNPQSISFGFVFVMNKK
jgi:hypothetical protein